MNRDVTSPTLEQMSRATPVLGILSIVFGSFAMLPFLGILSPLGLILGILALAKRQPITGVIGTSVSMLAAVTSPLLWVFVACMLHSVSCHKDVTIHSNVASFPQSMPQTTVRQ